jgi:hypothetical protein
MNTQEDMSLHRTRRVEALEQTGAFPELFATFSWDHWMDLQARVNQGFSRYLRAIECRRPDLALVLTLEMMETTADLLKEAIAWIEPPTGASAPCTENGE